MIAGELPVNIAENALRGLLKIQEVSLRTTGGLQEVLPELALVVNEVLGCHFCIVQPFDPDRDLFLVDQFTPAGPDEVMQFKWTMPRPNGSARTALRDGILVREDYQLAIASDPVLAGQTGAFRDVTQIVSSIGMRLGSEERPVGVFFANYKEAQHFTDDFKEIVNLFARQAGNIIQLRRQDDELERRAHLWQGILEMASASTRTIWDYNAVLQATITRIVKVLGFQRGAILRRETNGSRTVAVYDERGTKESESVGIFRPDSPFRKAVYQATEPIVMPDIETGADHGFDESERAHYRQLGIRSVIISPLRARGQALGTISLSTTSSTHVFSSLEIEAVQAVAGFSALAIDNARAYSELTQELLDVTSAGQSLSSKALDPTLDKGNFYRTAIDEAKRLLNAEAIWLLLREGSNLRIVAADANNLNDIGSTYDINACISGECITSGKPTIIDNIETLPPDRRLKYKAPTGSRRQASELVVPLLYGDEVIGAFNVESPRVSAFDEHDKDLLQLLANYVAVTIGLVEARETLKIHLDISESLARNPTRHELAKILYAARRLIKMRADTVVDSERSNRQIHEETVFGQILLFDETTGDFIIEHTTNTTQNDRGRRVDPQRSISGLAFQSARATSIIVRDVDKPYFERIDFNSNPPITIEAQTESKNYFALLEENSPSMKAEFVVPIIWKSDIIGLVNLETPRSTGFSEEQRSRAESYVSQHAQQFCEMFEDRLESGQALLEGALTLADCNDGQILRLHDEHSLVIEYTTGLESVGIRVDVGTSVSGRAVALGQSYYLGDVTGDPDYKGFLGARIKSEMVVPLILEGKQLGAINLESTIPGYFTVEHAQVIAKLANQASIAVDRIRATEQKRSAEMSRYAGEIVHRLTNPLGAIGFRFDLLKKKNFYQDMLSQFDYMQTFISKNEADLAHAQKIVKEIRTEVGKEMEAIDLFEAITSGIQQARGQLDDLTDEEIKNLVPNDGMRVFATDRLSIVFMNLVDNARKAMHDTGRKRCLTIQRQLDDTGRWVTVSFRDTGKGIAAEMKKVIFDPNFSTTVGHVQGEELHTKYLLGSGLGLWWVKNEVENAFGGRIEEPDSDAISWTEFRVTLPLARNL